MAKYALIDNYDKLGMIIEADSLEIAEEVSSNVFGTKMVIALEGVEGAEKASPGCEWDGSKILPLPDSDVVGEYNMEFDLNNPAEEA
jgi:hypothetical protein